MTPVEILALIFAVAVLGKILVMLVKPKLMVKVVDKMLLKNHPLLALVYLAGAVVVGYYLLQTMTIVELAAATMFVALLIGFSYMAHAKIFAKSAKEFLKGKNPLKKCWFQVIIWVLFAVWVLYTLYA